MGRDLFWWLTTFGVITKTADSRLAKRMRTRGDLIIGSSTKALRRRGVTIRRRVVSTSAEGITFAVGHPRPACDRDLGDRVPLGLLLGRGARGHHRRRTSRPSRGLTEVPGLYFLGLPWQHTRGLGAVGFRQARRRMARRPDEQAHAGHAADARSEQPHPTA
jgi:putative flavoprotein involved in K+ transport